MDQEQQQPSDSQQLLQKQEESKKPLQAVSRESSISHQMDEHLKVEAAFRHSLVALKTKDKNQLDTQFLQSKTSSREPTPQGQNDQVANSLSQFAALAAVNNLNKNRERRPTVNSNSQQKEKELDIEQYSSGSEADDIDIALKRVREIPLEQYLSQEKVKMVEAKRGIQDKKEAFKGKKDDENGTRYANSRFAFSGYSDLSERGRRMHRLQQYKDVKKLKNMAAFLERQEKSMKPHERLTLDERIKLKRKRMRQLAKRRARGQSAGSDGNISSWSQQVPKVVPLVAREIQYKNRIAKPGLQTVDYDNLPSKVNAQQSIFQRSLMPAYDVDQSVQMSGMLVTKNQRNQTMTQYDLVPEVIYNALEIKFRGMLADILGPTIARQTDLTKQHQELYVKNHQFDTKLRDCQLGIKKQLNMKAEFEKFNDRLVEVDNHFATVEANIAKQGNLYEGKFEKCMAQMRVCQSDIKACQKFIQKKNEDTVRIQEIVSSFKDRLIEKFGVLSDEYTEQFKTLQHRNLEFNQRITKILKQQDMLKEDNKQLKVSVSLESQTLKDAKAEIDDLQKCYKYEGRIEKLEHRAKSDLLAITHSLNKINDENSKNLKRTDAIRLIYAVQSNLARKMIAIDEQLAKGKAFEKKQTDAFVKQEPKFEPTAQATMNMLDWQLDFIRSQPFFDANVDNVIVKITGEAEYNVRAIRTEKLMVQLNAKKVNQKLARDRSLPKELIPDCTMFNINMPEQKTKVVKFQRQAALIMSSNTKSQKNLQSALKKQTTISSNKSSMPKLRQINRIFEPNKKRELQLLSVLKRSPSYNWSPQEKQTINNLWEDPTKVNLMERLRNTLASTASLASPKLSQSLGSGARLASSPTQRDGKEKRDKPEQQKQKAPAKERQPRERKPRQPRAARGAQGTAAQNDATQADQTARRPPKTVEFQDVINSNLDQTESQKKLLETVDEENKSMASRQHLQHQINIQLKNNSNRARDSSSSRSTTPLGKMPQQRNTQSRQSSNSEALFSSDGDDLGPVQIDPAYYQEFISHEDFEDEVDQLKEDLKDEIMEAARDMVNQEANNMVTEHVEQAQINIAAMLEEQLKESQEKMKAHMNNEVKGVQLIVDNLKNRTLPDNLKRVQEQIDQANQTAAQELEKCMRFVNENIKNFADKVNYFETEVGTIMKKFKRMVSDQEVFQNRVTKIQKRTQEMVKVMRSEQLANSKITSTLVELEFVQQSLDYQDEFDKTQMHLYGLNDLNMNLEEFISKSSEIASRKVRHEALQQATDVEREQMGDGDMKKDFFEMTNSGTYQAIEMSEEWPDKICDENLRKQIHQAFKMACVYYKPSPVLYRGNKYNRRALIEAKRQILDADWQLMLKFQPFKRLWGEDSSVDFFEQFTSKLHVLIESRKNGVDTVKFLEDSTEDTFLKIMGGTNIFDMKLKEGELEDDLLSSDYDAQEGPQILNAAVKEHKAKLNPLNISSSMNLGIENTQSSIKLQQESQETREMSKLQSSARNKAIEVISNRKKKNSPESHAQQNNTIDSRTKSMLNAIQGKSIFSPTQEDSIFATSEMEKNNLSKVKSKQRDAVKKYHNRSVQKIEEISGNGMFGEFLHQPFWMNQSQVIYEHGQNQFDSMHSTTKLGQIQTNVIQHKSTSRNDQRLQHYNTEKDQIQNQNSASKKFMQDNPMVQMRPLIGKEQIKQTQRVSQGTDTHNLDLNQNDYAMRKTNLAKSIGRSTQFSMSPWTRPGGQNRSRYIEKQKITSEEGTINMTIIGKKETIPESPSSSRRNKGLQSRSMTRPGANSDLQRSQVIKQTTVNFPLSLPIQTINMSIQASPINSNEQRSSNNLNKDLGGKSRNSVSQAVLTLPQVVKSSQDQFLQQAPMMMHQQQLYGEISHGTQNDKYQIKADLGERQQMSYGSLAESRYASSGKRGFNNNQVLKQIQSRNLPKYTDGVVSATSLWTPEDDLGSKMQAKLGQSIQSDPQPDSTEANMQKLKDIARQKKLMMQESATSHDERQ